ncbi:hypothetical protein MSG28_008275 [Choristoneura fumiferana]|uniref:Uncharacterized protein n=1 Tax=Choristoneura fumiferana TaxID=7141 RepID=A0ACC0JAU9_CHOFU|nr:hypothetical protein MSG28_008275 [Choristoneura fumiferana]
MSESEFEDDTPPTRWCYQSLASRGAAADSKSALRLFELGPRISLQLIKETEKRKAQQEENIKRKQREKDELKTEGSRRNQEEKEGTESQRLMELAAAESQDAGASDDADDDAEYYRKEVGAEPDKDLFSAPRKRKADDDSVRGFKKMRLDKKLKKKYQPNQDGNKEGKFQNRDGGNRKFQNKEGGGRNFQNKDGGGSRNSHGKGGRNFPNKEGAGGGRNFQNNREGGGRKFHGKNRDGGRNFQNDREGGRKFHNNKEGRNFQGNKGRVNKDGGKPKKVFGGKINKFKSGKQSKGKNRK